jgi:hypothetical protein
LAATAEQMTAQSAQLQELMQFFTVDGLTAAPERRAPRRTPSVTGLMPRQPRSADPGLFTAEDAMFDRF